MNFHRQKNQNAMMFKPQHPARKLHALSLAVAGLWLQTALSAQAQVVPDAGQILQQQAKPPAPPPQPGKTLQVQTPATEVVLPGGSQVTLNALQFSGNSVIDSAKLQLLLADAPGQRFDMAGLRGLVDRVSAHYHQAGYLFARAYLPPQDLAAGVLRIEVLEGRYGQTRVQTEQPGWSDAAQAYFKRLAPDSVIEGAALERATLLLSDLPGVQSTPVMQPGTRTGTGDLVVALARGPAISGSIGADNQGNRYSGQHRVHGALDWNSPLRLGDKLSLRSMLSDEQLWLGSLAYSLALGSDGLLGSLSYAHTSYELGREFASLGATGTAKVGSAGLVYSLLRSNQANLKLSGQVQHKSLRDDQLALHDRKTSVSVPLGLDFDRRDALGGGGLTFGSLSLTAGRLSMPEAQAALDSNNTRGQFQKINLDLVRLQSLSSGFSAYGRFSGQWANKNLDSSERTSLGGASGVRAYPSGEATGDQGWLLQAELRWSQGAWEPYAFIDTGDVRINAKPAALMLHNRRELAGSGLGLRYQAKQWELNAAVAAQTRGGQSQADGGAGGSTLGWVNASYRF